MSVCLCGGVCLCVGVCLYMGVCLYVGVCLCVSVYVCVSVIVYVGFFLTTAAPRCENVPTQLFRIDMYAVYTVFAWEPHLVLLQSHCLYCKRHHKMGTIVLCSLEDYI